MKDLLKALLQTGKFAWKASVHEVLAETGIDEENFHLELAKEYVLQECLNTMLQNIFSEGA